MALLPGDWTGFFSIGRQLFFKTKHLGGRVVKLMFKKTPVV